MQIQPTQPLRQSQAILLIAHDLKVCESCSQWFTRRIGSKRILGPCCDRKALGKTAA
jgi:hypothetical protein